MKMNTMGFVMMLFFVVVVLVISGRGILKSLQNLQSISESKSFRKTKGKVTDVSLWFAIEENHQVDDIPIFKAVKTYEYTVNGKTYSNNKNQLFDDDLLKGYKPVSTAESYEKWILDSENYKQAQRKISSEKLREIPVFYDKKNPEISCLQTNFDAFSATTLALNIFLFVGATVAIFYLFKNR